MTALGLLFCKNKKIFSVLFFFFSSLLLCLSSRRSAFPASPCSLFFCVLEILKSGKVLCRKEARFSRSRLSDRTVHRSSRHQTPHQLIELSESNSPKRQSRGEERRGRGAFHPFQGMPLRGMYDIFLGSSSYASEGVRGAVRVTFVR